LEIVDPTRYPDWDDLVATHPGSSVFHSSSWANLLIESYGFRPRYILERSGEGIEVLMPLMEVGGTLTGRRGVALPFSDYADPLYASGDALWGGWERTLVESTRSGWKTIEIRSQSELPPDFTSNSTVYCHHIVDLREGESAVLLKLNSSTRRNLRKAEKEGVEAKVFTSLDSIEQFYRLNCLTRKEHGLPPQPLRFFRSLYERILKTGQGFVVLASFHGEPIAANVFLRFGDRAYYKYGASDRLAQHLRGSNVAMWAGILHCTHAGVRSLCLGRTEPEHQGLRHYKSGWGASESNIVNFKYDIAKRTFVRAKNAVTGWHNRVFKALPIHVSRAIGTVLYKHMG
jgi:hypothetical protein